MGYKLSEIEYVEAIVLSGYKTIIKTKNLNSSRE